MVVVPLAIEPEASIYYELVVGIDCVVQLEDALVKRMFSWLGGRTYAMESVGPGSFEQCSRSDGIVYYWLTEHWVLFPVFDLDAATSDCVSLAYVY